MPSENVRQGIDTGSGGSAITVTEGHEKPYRNKNTSLTQTDPDKPLPLHGATTIPSSMSRERSGIFYCPEGAYETPEVWGDRKFSSNDRLHIHAKPQDTGK